VDVSNEEYGVSLLNDCRYAFDVRGPRDAGGPGGTMIRMTLLRGFPDMSPEADAGEHELHYALYPHAGPWHDADTVRQGWAFNMPLIARQALRRAGAIAPWVGPGINHAMPPAFGFLTIEQENVVLTAFKLEDEVWGPGSPVIARFYETSGKETEALITFAAPLMMIEETTHLEVRLEDQDLDWDGEAQVTVRFRPHEIKTFRLRLAIPAFAIYEGAEHQGDRDPGTVPGFGDG
jgi:alpha-mannosidase